MCKTEDRYKPESSGGVGSSKDASAAASMCGAFQPLADKVRSLLGYPTSSSRVDTINVKQKRPPKQNSTGETAERQAAYNTWLALLSGHQIQEIKEAFKKFDRDGSGYMCDAASLHHSLLAADPRCTALRGSDASELHATMKMMGSTATKDQV